MQRSLSCGRQVERVAARSRFVSVRLLPRASAIFTGSIAGNRSILILLAKFEVLFNRQEPGCWAQLGGSQSGSQRAQPSGDAERRPATITPGECHIGRREPTSGDWAELIWEQEVAGSNPAIPTIFRICYLLVGAIPVASCCRPMSASVAQRLCTLAPTSPPDQPTILSIESVFDYSRTACRCEVARSRRFFRQATGDHQLRRSDQVSLGQRDRSLMPNSVRCPNAYSCVVWHI